MRNIKPKVEKYDSVPMVKPSKSKPIYPTFRMDLEFLPEAKDWKVGKTYEIKMKVKMIGLSQSRFDNSSEYEIRAIETADSEDVEDESEDESAPESEEVEK